MEDKAKKAYTELVFATYFAMFSETLPQSFQPLFIAGLGVAPTVVAPI